MERVRIDKWLWAARFFKTRSLAQSALRGGHVDINGHPCKPSRAVEVGDRLRIVRGEVTFELEVVALAERRGPAREAAGLYRETEASIRRREQRAAERRLSGDRPGRRPDKRDRRRLRSLTGKS